MTTITKYKEDFGKYLQEIITDQFPHVLHTDVQFDKPRVKEHGDFSTNYFMKISKSLAMAPKKAAELIVSEIDCKKFSIQNISIDGPGFVNFKIDRTIFLPVIDEIVELNDDFGQLEVRGENVNIEFVSANPTGDLHLGHARGAAIGDSLARIMIKAGFNVCREYYINDGGNQVELLANSMNVRYLQRTDPSQIMPDDAYHAQDITDIVSFLCENYNVDALNEEDRRDFFRKKGVDLELDKIKKDLADFRVEFDVFSSEREMRENGEVDAVLDKLKSTEYVYESESALWLKTTSFGDDKDRVLIKSDHSLTYITPDIAYHKNKFNRGFSTLIDIVGGDHHGYVARMKAAVEVLGYNPKQLEFEIIQIVRLMQDGTEVKMSKRTGKALKLRDLSEELSVDVVRYFFVMRSVDSPLDFDLDLAIRQSSENPVYYIQYAYARIQSILRQFPTYDSTDVGKLANDHDITFDLIEKMAGLEDVVRVAAEKREPHLVANYVYGLAGIFHSYYGKVRIQNEDKDIEAARLQLIRSCAITIKNALELIGVNTKDTM